MAEPQLVIFDCDGVLVDSEPISVAVLLDTIAAAGGYVTEDEAYRLFLGRSLATVRGILDRDFGLSLTVSRLDAMQLELERRFRAALKPVPGVADVLAQLRHRCCVASSGAPERIRLSLGQTGLLEMLEPRIYSASMVEKGKPAPDLFLHVAHDLGVEPKSCLVIEDSPAGIDAARAAGMRVFAFTGASHSGHAAVVAERATRRPDAVFADMRMLPELLRGLGVGPT